MKDALQAQGSCTVAQLRQGQAGRLLTIGGDRSYRRRLLELGLIPGVAVRVLKVAPLGDPLEIEVRGARLSLRRAEASQLRVVPMATAPAPSLRALFASTQQTAA